MPAGGALVFVGFMGAGKTTAARAVGRELGVEALDTDELVERELGMPIARFFDEHGEAAFRNVEQRVVVELLGGTEGCTHLTEMLSSFPTAAIQSMFRKPRDQSAKPFQLDRCHALKTTGEAVRRYYPRWYRGQA